LPYIGSVGAVDMVNFGPPDTVPEAYRGRQFYQHNPQITLMRTTAAECAEIGQWIASKLNLMDGPVRFYLPEGGVSTLDAPGQAFHDPAAREALFRAMEATFRPGPNRRLLRVRHHINDAAFAAMVVAEFQNLLGPARPSRKRQGVP
ncbi:MAG: Tm-1-like ATP-binding domain-containing protein, partial [Roseomonas sp.]|nr:Tm-1-like ATP-binding domain-containing protein [Roseomonas sp.]